MTKQEVIQLIQQWIVANGNNEITANVLRPILEAMLLQPNDLIGDLTDLNTTENTSLVAAINESLNSTGASLNLYTGTGLPTETPPPVYTIGDLYVQINEFGTQGLYQWNGFEWVRVTKKLNSAVREVYFGVVPTAGTDTTMQEIVDLVNDVSIEIYDNEMLILGFTTKVSGISNVFASYFFARNDLTGTYGNVSINGMVYESDFILNTKTTDLAFLQSQGTVITLGDIGFESVENYLNTNPEPFLGDWLLDSETIYFFNYTKDGNEYVDLYEGTQPAQLGLGGNYTVLVTDFSNISYVEPQYTKSEIDAKIVVINNLIEAAKFFQTRIDPISGKVTYYHDDGVDPFSVVIGKAEPFSGDNNFVFGQNHVLHPDPLDVNNWDVFENAVIGGRGNEIFHGVSDSAIIAGYFNKIKGSYNAIIGGQGNINAADGSVMIGGWLNELKSTAWGSMVLGAYSTVENPYTIAQGYNIHSKIYVGDPRTNGANFLLGFETTIEGYGLNVTGGGHSVKANFVCVVGQSALAIDKPYTSHNDASALRFVVGIGGLNATTFASSTRKNGFEVYHSGTVRAASLTDALIVAGDGFTIITKQYLEANYSATGAADKNYLHTQGTPAATWNVAHNLGKYPSVTVLDGFNSEVAGEVTHTDINNLIINFNGGFSGTATIN